MELIIWSLVMLAVGAIAGGFIEYRYHGKFATLAASSNATVVSLQTDLMSAKERLAALEAALATKTAAAPAPPAIAPPPVPDPTKGA